MSADLKPGDLVNVAITRARLDVFAGETAELDLTPTGPVEEWLDIPLIDGVVTIERYEAPDPQFPATKAGGHALVIEACGEEFHGSCHCGEGFGAIRSRGSIGRTLAQRWERHITTQVPQAAADGAPATHPEPGSEIPGQLAYVMGTCGHRVAGSEWRAGFRTCERCPSEGEGAS